MNDIKINKIWKLLLTCLHEETHTEAEDVEFLLMYLLDANKIIETKPHQYITDSPDKNKDDKSNTYYNLSKIPPHCREDILDSHPDDWDLQMYFRYSKSLSKHIKNIHFLYNIIYCKKDKLNNSLINTEIMQIVKLIISNLITYDSKNPIAQKYRNKGLYSISRKTCIDELDSLLDSYEYKHIIIHATAGMGKRHATYEYVNEHPDSNLIWVGLPTDNISLAKQLTNAIGSRIPKSSFPPIPTDLVELLDLYNNLIIIERFFIDETDYSYIIDNLKFTKAKLIVISDVIKLNTADFMYELPVLDNDSLWKIFQETIKQKKPLADKAIMAGRNDFETILDYTGGNTLAIILFAKTVRKKCLDNNMDESSQLPYISHNTADGRHHHRPLPNILREVLIPTALKNDNLLSDFQKICFFVRGKCSMRVLNIFFDQSEIEVTIKEVETMGYADYTDNTELDVRPYISDAIWDFFNKDKSPLDYLDFYISRVNRLFIYEHDIMLTDAPYLYSLLATIYLRLTPLIPLIGGKESYKAGGKVRKLWEAYWDLLTNIYLFCFRVGYYSFANTILDKIYSYNTSKGLQPADNMKYQIRWELLHLVSIMSEGNRNSILEQMDSMLTAQTATSDPDFLTRFYNLYFDFIYQIISTNVIVLFNTPFIPSKQNIDNILRSFLYQIRRLPMPDDWKTFFAAYSIVLSVINRIGTGTTYDTIQDMEYARTQLLEIMLKSANQEIRLSATFLYDAGLIVFCSALENKTNEQMMIKDLAQSHIETYSSYIENKLVSKTLFNLYYITKTLLKVFSNGMEDIINSLPEIKRSIELLISVNFDDRIIL